MIHLRYADWPMSPFHIEKEINESIQRTASMKIDAENEESVIGVFPDSGRRTQDDSARSRNRRLRLPLLHQNFTIAVVMQWWRGGRSRHGSRRRAVVIHFEHSGKIL